MSLIAVFGLAAQGYNDQTQYAINGGDPLGLAFMLVFLVFVLMMLGTLLLVFRKRLRISIFNSLIAFVGVAALYFPLIVNGITPSGQDSISRHYWTRVGWMGVGMGVVFSLITIATTIKTLIPAKRPENDETRT